MACQLFAPIPRDDNLSCAMDYSFKRFLSTMLSVAKHAQQGALVPCELKHTVKPAGTFYTTNVLGSLECLTSASTVSLGMA